MTVNESISTFRLRLGEFDDDFTGLEDQAIYKLLSDSMSIIFTRYKDRWAKITDWMWSTFGVKLIMVNADMFPCSDVEHCVLLESEHDIPEPLMSKHKHMFKVFNGDMELSEYSVAAKYDNYLFDKPSWQLVNNKLRIRNTKVLKAITVKTIPYNFMLWTDLQYCPSTDTTECWNLDELIWPLMADSKMQGMCMDLALQSLGLTLNKLQTEPNTNASH